MRCALLSLVALATLASGCTYSPARLDYQGHPELHAVRMWNVDPEPSGVTKLGLVEADRGGWTGCDAMATDATLKLLSDAHAMGGAGVVETRYENPAYWVGDPRCQRNWALLGYMTVRARGYAVKDARHSPTAGVSGKPSKPRRRLKRAAGSPSRPSSQH
jgi:hypothetical protein